MSKREPRDMQMFPNAGGHWFLELGETCQGSYLFSDVWGLADSCLHFAKHFPLNFNSGISGVEFNW